MLIVSDKPKIIMINDRNLVSSFNNKEKNPKSGIIFVSIDTATSPQKPIKNTIGIITMKAIIRLFFKIS